MKSAKKAIKEILGNAGINDEERHTNVCGAERLSNSFILKNRMPIAQIEASVYIVIVKAVNFTQISSNYVKEIGKSPLNF